jgi:flagellar M-ring protein FliF
MADFQQQVRTQFIDFARRLSLVQKLALGGVVIGAVAGIFTLVTVVNRPTYGTLFSNLAPADASKIVDKLAEKKILYQLEDNGKTILVPKDKIYDVRLSLAGDGLPQSSIIGYEIFDRTNLGVSDFVQKINYRRALEGEIARTILQLEEVEGARVHIVVPDKALFKEDEKATTASIVLKLRSGKALRKENVQGMVHLVASSVEGLDPSNITIVDSRGTMLSDTEKPNSLTAKTSTQYEMQQKVENYLAQKAQSMLEGVVGTGNARVQVTADLDFRQVERTLEQYDPDKTVVRSEQVTEEKNVTKDSVQPSTRSSTVTNYEVNKTLERVIENVGGIRRLSVAAIVNGTRVDVQKNGQTGTEYKPRNPNEMNQLNEIVKRAVGFDPARHDEVSVVNLPFGTEDTEGFVFKESPGAGWKNVLEDDTYGKLFMIAAMIGAVIMLWLLLNTFRRTIEAPEVGQQVDMLVRDRQAHQLALQGIKGELAGNREGHLLPAAEDVISDTAKLKAERQARIEGYIAKKPKEAGRLLKVWLADA